LSKYPITQYENFNVSTNPLERRGLLHAQIKIEGRSLHLVCLHLDLLERGRQQQMRSLVECVHANVPHEAPLIVAGDFNDWQKRFSDSLSKKLGLRECGVSVTGEHAPTFPSTRPFLSLDRVYVRGFTIHEHEVLSGLPWKKMSDHAAVLVEIELFSGSAGKP
jgi:endonuclease/exonuclease/phosphatase family metal-dependent hydrolase